jgi:hypothetical protein
MFFRVQQIATGLRVELKENEPLEFAYRGEPRIVVRLRPPSSQDRLRPTPDTTSPRLVAEAITERDLSPEIQEIFGKLEASHDMEEARVQRQLLEAFEREVFGGLTDHLRKTVSVFRWVMGYVESPINPLTFLGNAYSHDGRKWHDFVPRPASMTLSVKFGLPYRPKAPATICSDVVDLVARETEEPLGHQLFREAWSLRRVSLRSALVIGFAAGEVAFKQFLKLRNLKPVGDRTSWQNAVKRRLSEPRLPRLMLGKRIVRPPEKFLRTLTRSAELRNQIVHGGNVRLDSAKVERLLRAIGEFLWVLDLYSGHAWAIQHVNTWQEWLG